eukprot:5102363-Pyramimonas_sp.AAC.1
MRRFLKTGLWAPHRGMGRSVGGRAARCRSAARTAAWSDTSLELNSPGESIAPAAADSGRIAQPSAEQQKLSIELIEL